MIVHLRGPSGSGKSHIGYQFVGRYPTTLYHEGGWSKTKPRIYKYVLPGDLAVLGRYTGNSAIGGLDGFKPLDKVTALIFREAKLHQHLFFESLLLHGLVGPMVELADMVGRENMVHAMMDTPEQVCRDRIAARVSHQESHVSESFKAQFQRRESLYRNMKEKHNIELVTIFHDREPFDQVRKIYTDAGWNPGEERETRAVEQPTPTNTKLEQESLF